MKTIKLVIPQDKLIEIFSIFKDIYFEDIPIEIGLFFL